MSVWKNGVYGACVAGMILLAGCETEIVADYVMPAREVVNVGKVNVIAIRVNSRVTGNLAGDNNRNAGLLKKLLSKRLYQEGFYQVVDDIWGEPEMASGLAKVMNGKNPNHGYGETFIAGGQRKAKAVLFLELELELNSNPAQYEKTFELVTKPYVMNPVQPGQVPTSRVNWKAVTTQEVKMPYTMHQVTAKGKLRARFVSRKGTAAPEAYDKSFQITLPQSACTDWERPSQLKVLATALAPVVEAVVADISPVKEQRKLTVSTGGSDRVMLLLKAKAFGDAVAEVEQLDENHAAVAADYENQGVAFEVMGDFVGAKFAYENAVKANPESESAKQGARRVAELLRKRRRVNESVRQNN